MSLWIRPIELPDKNQADQQAVARSAPSPHGPGAIERTEMCHPPPRRVANPPSRRGGEHVVSPPSECKEGGGSLPRPPP